MFLIKIAISRIAIDFRFYFLFIIKFCWYAKTMSIMYWHFLNINILFFQFTSRLCFFNQNNFNTISWIIISITSKIFFSWYYWIAIDNDFVFKFIILFFLNNVLSFIVTNEYLSFFDRVNNFFYWQNSLI